MGVVSTDDAVSELNMSYMSLAQRLLLEDKATGMLRLGLTADVADAVAALSIRNIIDLASSGHVICVLRPSKRGVVSALTRPKPSIDIARLHVALALASDCLGVEEAV
ncbi:hypothetical protein WL99_02275 [Burkholderia cepacia]|uniref:flagellar transcriptional regulator FlhD n=1 Tax=Burkholderia cepacia TaxID=292 RepID=UPI00075CCB23|nr:flagellar transcriptional regulator FlhD [Burkholderia cepacia]KWH39382.1 hypothetical protein WL99_02275 [Burkholderia cepacia]